MVECLTLISPGDRRNRSTSFRKGETPDERRIRELEAKLDAMQQTQSGILQRVSGGYETDSVGGGLAADRSLKSFMDPHRIMSIEQKRELSCNFKKLPDDKLLIAVDIIRDNMPVDNDADDIVIDIDSLDNKTLWELKDFIDKAMPQRKIGQKKGGPSGPSRQSSAQDKLKEKKQKKDRGSDSDASTSSSSSSSSSDSDSDTDSNGSSTPLPGAKSNTTGTPGGPAIAGKPLSRPTAAPVASTPPPRPATTNAVTPTLQSNGNTFDGMKKTMSFSMGGLGAKKPTAPDGLKKPVELKNMSLLTKDDTETTGGTTGAVNNALWDEHQRKAQQVSLSLRLKSGIRVRLGGWDEVQGVKSGPRFAAGD